MDSLIPNGQKNTLAEYMILSSADNRPPMLDKPLYDSWKSIMELYMQNREHGRMILQSVEHGPLDWPSIEVDGVTRLKKYAKLSASEKLQAGSMGTSPTTHASLPPEWSKFMTDLKLVRDLHTTNFHQLKAYLEQHDIRVNEVRIMCERNQDPLALVASHQNTPSHFNTYQSSYNHPQYSQQLSPSQSPQYGSIHPTQHYLTTCPFTPLAITYSTASYPNAYSSTVHQEACPQPQYIDSGLVVRVFKQGDDPIDAINKMMTFLSIVVTFRFPSTNNQLINSSNPRQQTTIIDGRVTVQPVQGRQSSFTVGTYGTKANISGTRRNNSGQQRVVKCFNCQGEGHIARQCPKLKRKTDATWFRVKVLLVKAQGSDDLDAYDSYCDDFSTAKAVLMANLSSYRSDVLSERIITPCQSENMRRNIMDIITTQLCQQ
ncbi:integrase, catalytic region, zinc finger, CCHC-type containing protein [Tanacetum coccineum]